MGKAKMWVDAERRVEQLGTTVAALTADRDRYKNVADALAKDRNSWKAACEAKIRQLEDIQRKNHGLSRELAAYVTKLDTTERVLGRFQFVGLLVLVATAVLSAFWLMIHVRIMFV